MDWDFKIDKGNFGPEYIFKICCGELNALL